MTSEIALRFNYDSLPGGAATEVARRTREIKSLTRRAAADIVQIGKELAAVRDTLPYGQFGTWLQVEFSWSERHARNMIAVAEKFSSANFAEVDLAPSALYLLSGESVPDEARAEAVTRAKAGERVTHTAAKEIVAKHKPPQPESGFPKGYSPYGTGKKATAKKQEPKPAPAPSTNGHVPPVKPAAPAPKPEPAPAHAEEGELATLEDVLESLQDAADNIDEYARTDAGRCADVPRALSCLTDAKKAVVGGKASHVIAADVAMPAALETPECRQALDDWLVFKRKKGKSYKDATQVERLVRRCEGMGAVGFCDAVDHSIAQGYDGIHPARSSSSPPTRGRSDVASEYLAEFGSDA